MIKKRYASPFEAQHYKIPHPQARTRVIQDIMRCFARDYPASHTAKLINRDIRTINPIYQWLRRIVAEHYQQFLRFREHDMDYDLMLFLSHSAMATMYWLETDKAEGWDKHTVLLRGEAPWQHKTTAELMRHTYEDPKRLDRYMRHTTRNYHWLTDKFIQCRMKRLRTPMLNHPHFSRATLYRFLVTVHVLNNHALAEDLSADIQGRHIGSERNLQKAGVLHVDRLFEKYFINGYEEIKANIIFSDLMDWLAHHPDA